MTGVESNGMVKLKKLLSSLVPRPSHVFQCMREKSGRPDRFGDVFATISATDCTNGGSYIISSPNRPGLPDFSCAHWEGLRLAIIHLCSDFCVFWGTNINLFRVF